jgi:argininosuccinate lyase
VIAKTAAAGGNVLDPRILAFTSSLASDLALVREDLAGSLAHVSMLGETGLVPADVAAALRGGLLALAEERRNGKLALPDEEDVHMAIEGVLAARLGPPAALLHTARSRNDQVATVLRLHVREASRVALTELSSLALYLVERAEAERDVVLPAYTHRQRAQPISLAYFWLSHATALTRDLDTFSAAYAAANVLPLGVGAIAGTSLAIDRNLVRDRLRFASVSLNGMDTVGDRDFELDYAYAAARLLVHTSRLAQDLVDFASQEFGFVRLDGDIACGSSMMPQKRNPDVFELVRGKSGAAIGDLVALLTTVKGLPSGYNRDLQEDRGALLATEARVNAVLGALAVALPRVHFDAARCGRAVDEDAMQATDLAEALVSKGMPFRLAYQAVGSLVRLCQEEKITLAQVTLEKARSVDAAFDEVVLQAADPRASVGRKVSAGSTGPASIDGQISELRGRLHAAKRSIETMPALDALLASFASPPTTKKTS